MHKSIFTWDGFTWICIYMDLRSRRLWENFCALLSFAAHALANSEHFISCVFKFERADLAVSCCAKGADNGFGISAFPKEKSSTTGTSDKWDTARVPPAPEGSSSTAGCVLYLSRAEQSRAGLHRSCQGVDGCGEGSPCWGHGHGIQQGRAGRAGREMLPSRPKGALLQPGSPSRPGSGAGELGVIVPGC